MFTRINVEINIWRENIPPQLYPITTEEVKLYNRISGCQIQKNNNGLNIKVICHSWTVSNIWTNVA